MTKIQLSETLRHLCGLKLYGIDEINFYTPHYEEVLALYGLIDRIEELEQEVKRLKKEQHTHKKEGYFHDKDMAQHIYDKMKIAKGL